MAKDKEFPQKHLQFFGYDEDRAKKPSNRKMYPKSHAALNALVTTPTGILGGVGVRSILSKFLRSKGVQHTTSNRVGTGVGLAVGLALPMLVGSNTYKKDMLQEDMVKAYLKNHDNKASKFEDIYKSTMPREKIASLVLLYKFAATGMSNNELNFLGNHYKKDKAKYKNLVSKYSGKEDEVHQEVMKAIQHPHPQSFYKEFNTTNPNANSGRRNGFNSSYNYTPPNYEDMFRKAWEGRASEAKFPKNLSPEEMLWAGSLVGLTGLGVHEYTKYKDYRNKFNKKNPSHAH